MKAVCWYGVDDVRVANVPEPAIRNPRDVILRVTRAAICGSDLHLLDGYIPGMQRGDILGHEFMGEVVEVGSAVKNLTVGDRVVVPFNISCGHCWYCQQQLYSCCDNSNPKHTLAEALNGSQSTAALFGYSHTFGGYAGGQAEYVRVPFGDFGPLKVPDNVSDDQALFLGDVLSTAWQAAEFCNIHPGDVVAIWGCGPVGLLTIPCAYAMGAERVISIDCVPERLEMARRAHAETVDDSRENVPSRLAEMTGGRGPDCCVDAVGMEAHGHASIDAMIDTVKTKVGLATDHGHALREAIYSCRKGGTVSIPGVYGGLLDKFPIGPAFGKALTLRMGQTHVQKHMKLLMEKIISQELDPTFIVTHRVSLADVPSAYRMFRDKQDGCVKCLIAP